MSNSPYIDPDGIVYESYEAYCNSPDLDTYTIMLKLHNGVRKPQNDFERSLLAEMREIEASGGQIDSICNLIRSVQFESSTEIKKQHLQNVKNAKMNNQRANK